MGIGLIGRTSMSLEKSLGANEKCGVTRIFAVIFIFINMVI